MWQGEAARELGERVAWPATAWRWTTAAWDGVAWLQGSSAELRSCSCSFFAVSGTDESGDESQLPLLQRPGVRPRVPPLSPAACIARARTLGVLRLQMGEGEGEGEVTLAARRSL